MRRAASWRAAPCGARDNACAARTYTPFENFLAVPASARITHLVLPHFVGVPPAVHIVPPNAAPHLAVLDNSPGLALALGSNHLLTLSDGLHPAALFGTFGSTRKELGLILAPNVEIRTRGRIRARGWRYSSSLGGTSDEALRTPRLQATLATEAPKAEEVPSRGMDTASAGIGNAFHRVSF
ncbi:hypothetical protein EDB89DRAFT_2041179 [Lactarius sanguifluus]|nr:hypothetical protein EDB89DRAFT_2041179 [Lactarius sanguifluus]